MIGYKAFDENLQCKGFQFEVGKSYDTGRAKEDLRLCSDTVFHFCRELYKIENVSDYRISKSRVCEVIAEGDVVTDGDKYGTNKLFILREIPREEVGTAEIVTAEVVTAEVGTADFSIQILHLFAFSIKKQMFHSTKLIFQVSCVLTLLFGFRTIQQRTRKKKHTKLILKLVADL